MPVTGRLALLLCAVFACGSDGAATHGERSGGGDVDIASHSGVALQGDALAARADSLVRAGRPWRATVLLAPSLKSPAAARPELRLAGARAAAGWDGWSEVERVLRGADWLDRQFAGEGRELLVRSALERDSDALPDARLALADATTDASRAVREVLLARAYDRARQRDSAAVHYAAVAARLPAARNWLLLRAAGVTGESGARAALLGRVGTEVARARV
ncbi:MAG: hypothetical protein H0W68_05730, partial [Gemmatimonadaceae bacterium]|nr:hypothetical protein [Gemmatimonadaceae bacterium]